MISLYYISMLPKIFLKIINEKISLTINSFFLYRSQHSFRMGHSTIFNLAIFTQNIIEYISASFQMDTVYVGFEKAFDRVDHFFTHNKLKKLDYATYY